MLAATRHKHNTVRGVTCTDRKNCNCCFGGGTSHCYHGWCRLQQLPHVMANVHRYLRLACTAPCAELLKELRVSTWLIKSTLSTGDQFYEGVATNGRGWVWLHQYGYRSLPNRTYRTAMPTLEWSFSCDLAQAHRDDVSWAYVSSAQVAHVMSDVVAVHRRGSPHSDALKLAGIHKILQSK